MERNDALSCLPFGAQIKGLRIGSSECWAPPPDRHRAHTVWNMVAQRYGEHSEHPSSLPLKGTENTEVQRMTFMSSPVLLWKIDFNQRRWAELETAILEHWSELQLS